MNVWNEIMCEIDVFEIKSIALKLRQDYGDTVFNGSVKNFQDYVEDRNGVVLSGPAKDLAEKFNVEYKNGYGLQELFGTIWMKDGTWYTRSEYDGAEWWTHHECPDWDDDMHKDDF